MTAAFISHIFCSLTKLIQLSFTGGSKNSKKQTSGSTSNAVSTGGEQDDASEGSGDEFGGDNLEEGHTGGKQVRETERRYANNARERSVSLIGF